MTRVQLNKLTAQLELEAKQAKELKKAAFHVSSCSFKAHYLPLNLSSNLRKLSFHGLKLLFDSLLTAQLELEAKQAKELKKAAFHVSSAGSKLHYDSPFTAQLKIQI